MKTTKQNETQYTLYDSVDEMLAGVALADPDRVRNASVSPTRASFIGRQFGGWDEVYEAARSEWAEGIEQLERMLRELGEATMPTPKSRKRRTRFDEAAGDEVDYDRLRGGQDFWRVTRRETTDGPATITLFVEMSTRCSVAAEAILWRGAAAIVLTKLLEQAGYRVELWAVEKTIECYPRSRKFPHQCTGVCLKRTGDPLDLSTLINAVSGWFFRTVFFRNKCLSENQPASKLGRPRSPSDDDLNQFSCDARRRLVNGVWAREAAIGYVRDQLRQLAS